MRGKTMTLPRETRKRSIHWIKRNAEKKKYDVEAAAINDWASEGGSVAHIVKAAITTVKGRKRFICYYQRAVQHGNSHHGYQ
jgi:hypothetical protein